MSFFFSTGDLNVIFFSTGYGEKKNMFDFIFLLIA